MYVNNLFDCCLTVFDCDYIVRWSVIGWHVFVSGCGEIMDRKHLKMPMCVSLTPLQLALKSSKTLCCQVSVFITVPCETLINIAYRVNIILTLLLRNRSLYHSWWTQSVRGGCWKQVKSPGCQLLSCLRNNLKEVFLVKVWCMDKFIRLHNIENASYSGHALIFSAAFFSPAAVLER